MSALKLPAELQHRIHAYHDFLDLYRKHEVPRAEIRRNAGLESPQHGCARGPGLVGSPRDDCTQNGMLSNFVALGDTVSRLGIQFLKAWY